MSQVACCMLHVACCMLHVACRMLHVACCMLHVARCVLHVACCMLALGDVISVLFDQPTDLAGGTDVAPPCSTVLHQVSVSKLGRGVEHACVCVGGGWGGTGWRKLFRAGLEGAGDLRSGTD